MKKQLLSRAECNAIRGLAIIGIFLHNYCHWLGPVVKENEYQFFQSNAYGFVHALSAPDLLLPMHLFSFFGHYGVPVFLFLSAYGLVMKYETLADNSTGNAEEIGLGSVASFMQHHYKKLFKMMILGFVAFTMTDLMTPKSHHYAVLDIVAMLGMFNNLLPNPDDIIWPGPYWFFGLMLQLYLIFRLFIARRHWGWTVGLMVVCVVLQCCFGPESEELNRYRYNFMGGMLPFGLGILYARYGRPLDFKVYVALFVGSLFMIFGLSMNFIGWTFVPVFVCTAAVSMAKLLSARANPVNNALVWTGTISAALFVCHPVTRKIFIPISRGSDLYAGFLLYIVTSICLAWAFREIIKRIPIQ